MSKLTRRRRPIAKQAPVTTKPALLQEPVMREVPPASGLLPTPRPIGRDEIATAAYYLYIAGRPGRPEDHWHGAEEQLRTA